VSRCLGYLRDVEGRHGFGLGSRGNLIVYDDCLVFAAVRRPLVNSVLNIPELVRPSSRDSRFDSLGREQAQLAPDELVARSRHNWLIRSEDVVRAVLGTSRGAGGPAGDDVVDLVLGAGLALGASTAQTLRVHLSGYRTRMCPFVEGIWGDAENDLLRSALGDKLT
jgi:hypothetical protein